MRTRIFYGHATAWLLAAILASCSHEEKKAPPPPPPKPTAAEESQKSFQLAAQEQAALNEQLKRADAAHANTLLAQQQLAQAQAQEQVEHAKAEQLQNQANQHIQEGMRHAQQAQVGLIGMGGSDGLQTATGTVTVASPTQIAIQAQGGKVMTFAVDSHTRVLLGTEQRSTLDIQRGADAQVAYEPKGNQMTALVIRLSPAGGTGTGAPSRNPMPATPPNPQAAPPHPPPPNQ